MAVLPLVIAPDERLNRPSHKVEVFDDELRAFAKDLLDTMYANDGIGLAAVQVGVHKRVIAVDVARRDGGNDPQFYVNPEIIEEGEDISIYQEGCLSFPDQFSDVERPEGVKIRYQDLDGKEHTVEAHGILATCLQHEIDHTNGIVFVDHISKLKRDMIIKKLTKQKKLGMFSDVPEPVQN
jgi:peptide deformylase